MALLRGEAPHQSPSLRDAADLEAELTALLGPVGTQPCVFCRLPLPRPALVPAVDQECDLSMRFPPNDGLRELSISAFERGEVTTDDFTENIRTRGANQLCRQPVHQVATCLTAALQVPGSVKGKAKERPSKRACEQPEVAASAAQESFASVADDHRERHAASAASKSPFAARAGEHARAE